MLLKLRQKRLLPRSNAALRMAPIPRILLILHSFPNLAIQRHWGPKVARDVHLCSSDYCLGSLPGERCRAEKSPDR
jgi:hypothetical protein